MEQVTWCANRRGDEGLGGVGTDHAGSALDEGVALYKHGELRRRIRRGVRCLGESRIDQHGGDRHPTSSSWAIPMFASPKRLVEMPAMPRNEGAEDRLEGAEPPKPAAVRSVRRRCRLVPDPRVWPEWVEALIWWRRPALVPGPVAVARSAPTESANVRHLNASTTGSNGGRPPAAGCPRDSIRGWGRSRSGGRAVRREPRWRSSWCRCLQRQLGRVGVLPICRKLGAIHVDRCRPRLVGRSCSSLSSCG